MSAPHDTFMGDATRVRGLDVHHAQPDPVDAWGAVEATAASARDRIVASEDALDGATP